MIVLNQSLLYEDWQDIGSRLAVTLLVASVILLEGDRVVTQQFLHEGVVQTGHDILAFRIRLLVNQIQDNGTYVSRYMSLSELRDYIIEQQENSTNGGN